jgi:sugar lactone lactonase YvrE
LVAFSYDAFTGAGKRTGTLSIAGLTFTVTQAGINYLGPGPLVTLVSSGLSGLYGGVAVDGSGNVYIADSGYGKIEQWSAATQQVTTIVPSGLTDPTGVAVDGFGNLYIANYFGSNQISEWSAATQQLTALVPTGLSNPFGVAVDGSGNVYIADESNSAIKEWNSATQQVTTLVSLPYPTGVAVDASGNVYVADYGNGQIYQFNTASNQLTTLVSSGLSSPLAVAVDGSGNVYIADYGNSAIKVWSPSTQQVTTLVSAGQVSYPTGVAVDASGNVYIADWSHGAITEMPYAFVGPASLTEPVTAGSDSLLPVLPSTASLTGIFAPISDQSWLTIGTVASGVVNFSFTANTSPSSRTAHIAVLGQQITVTQSGTVLTPQTITFPPLSNQPYGTAPFTVSATASSGLAVSFASTTPAICRVSGATVALVAVGTCTIQASQPGNANYAAAPPVNQSLQVTQGSQTITFGVLANQPYGTAPFTVTATASSGLTVRFTSLTTSICTVSDDTVTLVAVGKCTIHASQPGNADYAPATSVNQSFQVTKGSQTISFPPLSNQPYNVGAFVVSATASSGLSVKFASATTSVCTVSNDTVTLVAVGTCTIRASQPGNADYTAAAPVNQSFQVTKASQTISFNALPNEPLSTPPFTVTATASSGLPVSFASSTITICTVSGNEVTLVAIGRCTIRATQPGNLDYNAAAPVNQSFQVTNH